jgi:hypothetical protein
MAAESDKASRELRVFVEFLEKSWLPVDRQSIESRRPPEPDILCRHEQKGFIAFELVELCEWELAESIQKLSENHGISACFMLNSDPTENIVANKLRKDYQTQHPIELLCYTAGRIVTPDGVIIPTIREILDLYGFGPFRRVWFLGEESCQVIFEQEN